MHHKLLSYLKYLKAQDKGVLPFAYGKDLFDNAQYDDFNTVGLGE